MFKVIQLSDCHVSADPEAQYRGVNPRAEFEKLLPLVREKSPDLVVLTGDLAEDASDEAYEYLFGQMDTLGAPVLTIPGNHDDAGCQQKHFEATAVDDVLVYETGDWQLILLNTAVAGQISGALSADVFVQLRALLAEADKARLIMMHHQPVSVGSPWIDRYPLLESDKFWTCMEEGQNLKAVLWGHVHQEFASWRKGVQLLSTPSTAANSVPSMERFTPDGKGPACRYLELEKDGELTTEVLRTPG
jgi:Icc protein